MLTLGLIVIGGLLVWRVWPQLPGAPRAMGTVTVLTAGGLLLNVVSTARRHLAVRPVVRVSACVIGLALVAVLLALRHHIGASVLPGVPREDPELRTAMTDWEVQLLWLSVAVGYVVVSVALLPPRAKPEPVTAHGRKIEQGGDVTESPAREQSADRDQEMNS